MKQHFKIPKNQHCKFAIVIGLLFLLTLPKAEAQYYNSIDASIIKITDIKIGNKDIFDINSNAKFCASTGRVITISIQNTSKTQPVDFLEFYKYYKFGASIVIHISNKNESRSESTYTIDLPDTIILQPGEIKTFSTNNVNISKAGFKTLTAELFGSYSDIKRHLSVSLVGHYKNRTFEVLPLPSTYIVVDDITNLCVGNPVILTANTTSYTGPYNYVWHPAPQKIIAQNATAQRITFTPTTQGQKYWNVNVTDHNGCSSTATVQNAMVNECHTNARIEDVNTKPSMNIYPNPSSGLFNIQLNDTLTVKSIKARNYIGQEIELPAEILNSVDLSDQPQGMYFISITTVKDKTTTHKIIKQ